jgi:hypothetical protein
MIAEGTHPPISIDLGKDEPGMTLQRWDGNDWVDYKADGKLVKSPVDIAVKASNSVFTTQQVRQFLVKPRNWRITQPRVVPLAYSALLDPVRVSSE